MDFNGIQWNSMDSWDLYDLGGSGGSYGLTNSSEVATPPGMKIHEIQRNSMEFNEFQWNSMEFNGFHGFLGSMDSIGCL